MKRSTLVAVAVFVALLVATVYSLNQKPERGISRLTFANLDTDALDRIEVGGEQPVELSKKGDSWHLESGREADPEAVVASRLFPSLAFSTVPDAVDIGDVAFLLSLGYRTFLLGDEVCLQRDSVIGALNLLQAVAGEMR